MSHEFARQFNGTSDRLDTGLSQTKGISNRITAYAWINKPTETGSTIIGLINAADANQRLDFFCDLSSVGGFFLSLTFRGVTGDANPRTMQTEIFVDGRDLPIFVAAVNDPFNGRFRFFWGFDVDSIVEVPTGDFTTAITDIEFLNPTDGSVRLNIGALGREGLSAQNFFNGVIDSVGLEFDLALTLADLKLRAACGTSAGSHYWPITGDAPETGILVIHGTTVVPGICGAGVVGVPANEGQLLICI